MHARPAVAGLPDEVRDEQESRDCHCQRKPPRAQDVAAPDEEGRDEQDEDDGERVLRLEADAGGDPEQGPRAAPEGDSQSEPEDDHRRELIKRNRLEEQVSPEHPGEKPISTAASVCDRREPPSSRVIKAPTSTVPALARIVIARRPTSDQPNSPRSSAASSAVTGGNST